MHYPKNKHKEFFEFFAFMGNKFPEWISCEDIKKKGFVTIHSQDINNLVKSGFLETTKLSTSEIMKGTSDQKEDNFRLTPQGFNFLYNINTNRTNKLILESNRLIRRFTIIMFFIGLIQMGVAIVIFVDTFLVNLNP